MLRFYYIKFDQISINFDFSSKVASFHLLNFVIVSMFIPFIQDIIDLILLETKYPCYPVYIHFLNVFGYDHSIYFLNQRTDFF